jgi:uncharacterized protein DUF1801
MAKSKDVHDPEAVTRFIGLLEENFAALVEAIRRTILAVDTSIGEQIKWNSPAFFYKGPMKPFDPGEYKRDIVVLNTTRRKALLVFPTGARIVDQSGILEGDFTDGRRIIHITDMGDFDRKKAALYTVIRSWLQQVE